MKRTKYPKNGSSKQAQQEARYCQGLPSDQLLPSEMNFVHEILASKPVDEAVANAGFISLSQSKAKRRREAEALLELERVQKYLRDELLNRAARTRITSDRVLAEMGKHAFFDPADAFHRDGTPKSLLDMDPTTRAGVKEIDFKTIYAGKGENKVKTGYITNIKFHDKMPALQSLLKYVDPSQNPNIQINNYNDNREQTYYDNRTEVSLQDFSEQDMGYLKTLLGAEDEQEIAELVKIEGQAQQEQESE